MMFNINWLCRVHFDNPNHVGMKLMPPRLIGRKTCLQVKGLLRLLKNFKPKMHRNTWRKEKLKETKEHMKVGKCGVQHDRYDGHST
jgi:hypothetical protein